MDLENIIYSNDYIDYLINNYFTAELLEDKYSPDGYEIFDKQQGVVFKKGTIDNIQDLGYQYIPKCYGNADENAARAEISSSLASEILESTGVTALRRGIQEYGRGILFGVVGTGFDVSHPDFFEADGSSRILAAWDQTIRNGEPPKGFHYGTEFDSTTVIENEEALKVESDLAVDFESAILANQGDTEYMRLAVGKEGIGVAPGANILYVKCKPCKEIYRDYYGISGSVVAVQENDIMAGIIFLLNQARRLLRPICITSTLGTNLGNHQGRSNLDILMKRYQLVSGVAFVVPTGMEGTKRHHVYIPEEQRREENTVEWNVEKDRTDFTLELWFRGPGTVRGSLTSPTGQTFSINYEEKKKEFRYVVGNEETRVYAAYMASNVSADQLLQFRFYSALAGVWKLSIVADERLRFGYHLWLPLSSFLSAPVTFFSARPDTTITGVGNATELITVSSYKQRTGGVFSESSRGYNVDQLITPQLSAPEYGFAVVAGICILLLASLNRYEISGSSLQEILIQGTDNKAGVFPTKEEGFGKVNAMTSYFYARSSEE